MNQEIETTIIDMLRSQEPSTLEEICWELRIQQGLRTTEVLPIAITAISAMQEKGLICEYEQMPFSDPMEYAWVLAEEQPKPEAKPQAQRKAEAELLTNLIASLEED